MKTQQEQIEEMEKIIKTERKMLGSQIKVIKKRLNNKYVEIEQLKAKNWRLTEKLRQVLLSIDTAKEMNAMCDINEQIRQAVEEFAERLKRDSIRTAQYEDGTKILTTSNKLIDQAVNIYMQTEGLI